MTNFKKLLLAGTAVVAIGAFTAGQARADEEIVGTVAAPTDLSAITAEQLTNIVDDQASADDAAYINTNGGKTATNIIIDTNATVGFFDGTAGGDNIAFSGFADIASGTTLTLVGGNSEADGSGTDGAGAVTLSIAGSLGETGATSLTRGGSLIFTGSDDETNGGAAANLTVGGNTLLTAISVLGGDAGGTEGGTSVTATFGDTSADTFNLSGNLAVTGGNGDAAGARSGGTSTTTINGVATIAGNTTVTGGNDLAGGGNGGAASLVLNDGARGTGTLTVTGGTGTGAGTAGAASVLSRGNTTFSAITLDSAEGVASLTFDVATDATGDFTVTGAINGAAANEGTILVTDDSATTADTVTFASDIGNLFRLNAVTVGDGVGNEGGHAVFNGTVAATTVTVGAANTGDEAVSADFNRDLTATNLNIVADANVVAGTDAVVTAAGDVTAAISLDDGTNSFATINFDGTSAQTVTGAITAAADGEGKVIVSGKDVTFANAIGVAAGNGVEGFSVASGSIARISNDVEVDSATAGALNLDGTLYVDVSAAEVELDQDGAGAVALDGSLFVTGDEDFYLGGDGTIHAGWNDKRAKMVLAGRTILGDTASGANGGDDFIVGDSAGDRYTILGASTTNFNVATDAVIGDALLDGNGNLLTVGTGSRLRLGLASGTSVDAGNTIVFLDNFDVASDLDGELAAGDIKFINDGLTRLTSTVNTDNGTIEGRVSFRDATEVFNNDVNGEAANALLGMTGASTTGELSTIRGNLIAADMDGAEDIAESISPDVDGATSIAGVTVVTNNTLGLTGDRLAALRTGDETGMAAGNLTHGLKVWGQVFGTTGSQDSRDGVAGYDVDSIGGTVGIDTQSLVENWVWGLAFTYASTDVESDGVNKTETDIDSYQVALYADYSWDQQTYINGTVGYGLNKMDQVRHNVGLINGLDADADYDSDLWFARLETGHDFDMKNGLTLTPIALLNFSYLDTDDYSEAGAGNAGLNVDTDSQYTAEAGLGLEASWLHQLNDGSYLKPKVRAGYRYDFADDEVETTSTFQGAPTVAFNTEGFDPQKHTFDVGAGLTFYTTANWDLTANYDYQIKGDYDSHNGYVRAAYKF